MTLYTLIALKRKRVLPVVLELIKKKGPVTLKLGLRERSEG